MYKPKFILGKNAVFCSSSSVSDIFVVAYKVKKLPDTIYLYKFTQNCPFFISTAPASLTLDQIVSNAAYLEMINASEILPGYNVLDLELLPFTDMIEEPSSRINSLIKLADYYHLVQVSRAMETRARAESRARAASRSRAESIVIQRISRKPSIIENRFDHHIGNFMTQLPGFSLLLLLAPTKISEVLQWIQKNHPRASKINLIQFELPDEKSWTMEELEEAAALCRQQISEKAPTSSEFSIAGLQAAEEKEKEAEKTTKEAAQAIAKISGLTAKNHVSDKPAFTRKPVMRRKRKT